MNSLQEAYLTIYQTQLDERMSDDEKEMRRLAAQERRAGKSDRMDAKIAKKYADSEARSASREDKKSKGKHIAGMADSFEPEGEQIDEISANLALTASQKADNERRKAAVAGDKTRAAEKARQASAIYAGVAKRRAREKTQSEAKDNSYLETDMEKRKKNNEKAIADMKKVKDNTVPRWMREDTLDERALDATEKKEKERLVQGMKKSASSFKKKYGDRAKSVMYATATKQAKERMDTSKSDRRYGVEG